MASSGGARRKSGGNATSFTRKESSGGVVHKNQTASSSAAAARIKELEEQVAELKRRLDELRKAKSQTIVKKDKEYVNTDAPKLGQRHNNMSADDLNAYKEQIRSLQGKVRQVENQNTKEVENLNAEISRLKLNNKTQDVTSTADDNIDRELITELRKQNKELQEERDRLKAANTVLQLHVDDMLEALSKKEAEWCDREEKFTQQLKLSWGEKYQQWMAQTEKKIEELQEANNFLRMIIDREKPG